MMSVSARGLNYIYVLLIPGIISEYCTAADIIFIIKIISEGKNKHKEINAQKMSTG